MLVIILKQLLDETCLYLFGRRFVLTLVEFFKVLT
jgi:hypothetical protein